MFMFMFFFFFFKVLVWVGFGWRVIMGMWDPVGIYIDGTAVAT